MAYERHKFADKLNRYMIQLGVDECEMSNKTGISSERIQRMIAINDDPSGDEILIIADYFKCDFKFFISDEPLAPFEQTEIFYRKHGNLLNRDDRRSIQDFLFLCECQQFLMQELKKSQPINPYSFNKVGNFYKAHGVEAANDVRKFLEYKNNEGPKDIFEDFRELGINIFRRVLGSSLISGVFINHPVAGKCVLVNYSEDFFRQRFTVAHEVGHALLDETEDGNVSKNDDSVRDLSEVRANTFASFYLIPPEFIKSHADYKCWDKNKFLMFAKKLQVNPEPMAIALKNMELITDDEANAFKLLKISQLEKHDPELAEGLNNFEPNRKKDILERGLSDYYVKLCFEAYNRRLISWGRLTEMLMSSHRETLDISKLFGICVYHDN